MKFEIDLREKEFQDLMLVWIMRRFNETKIQIFREKNINGSVADIITFSPYKASVLSVYECKMFYDNDKKRLNRQIKDYSEVADYVNIVVFGKVMEGLPNNVNQLAVNLRNGEFTVERIGESDYWLEENPRENINWEKRLRVIKNLTDLWKTKVFYAEKSISYHIRKIQRLKKKCQ